MKRVAIVALLLFAVAIAALVAMLFVEGRRAPDTSGEYVALGSSFAAGPLLGERVPDSPHACWRSLGNYPHQLASRIGLKLVDVSCGGATARHLLAGGPLLQRAQIESIGPMAKLVTITVGGNDVDYARDLGLLAYRSRAGVIGFVLRKLWSGPAPVESRPFDQLQRTLVDLVRGVQRAAPGAKVLLVTYPNVMPEQGTCATIELDASEAALMRAVGQKLADVTRVSAMESGAVFVDIAAASKDHDACSADPWVNGAAHTAQFHPNLEGARAIAAHIEQVVRSFGE